MGINQPAAVQELVLQTALIHNGYVSECVWARSKMSAHVLFMLSEEAVATALTMSAVGHLAADRLAFRNPTAAGGGGAGGGSPPPRLTMRMSIASSGCDALHPDERTGRLVRPRRPPRALPAL